MTLVELLVASTIGLVLLGSAVPLFVTNRHSVEQQMAVRAVQTDVHVTVERLMRLIRSADAVEQESTGSRLVVSGGEAQDLCGGGVCWVEVTAAGLQTGRNGGGGVTRQVAGTATSLLITFGLDDNEDGQVDQEAGAIPGGRADDVLAVRLRIRFEETEGRGSFSMNTDFVVALRTPILDRTSF